MKMTVLIVPTLILLWGLAEDLRQKKVPNQVVLICACLGIINSIYLYGWNGLADGLLGAGAAIVIMLPLVLMGIVGAGDMKLTVAFGLSYYWQGVLMMTVSALVWGALLGVARAALSGELSSLAKNTAALVGVGNKVGNKTDKSQMHSIPYTVALFFGWVTHISYLFYGVNPFMGGSGS